MLTPCFSFHQRDKGLLYATQFAQIALVVTERAALEDMRARGLVQRDTAFAGHSLGEYSALASIADVLPTSALVDVVFYRGITMQRAVERDAAGRSNYAMCAVNPSRVNKSFSDAALREIVDTVATRSDCLVEIVNYNVEVSFFSTVRCATGADCRIGPAIRLRRRARRSSELDERVELPQGAERRHREGTFLSFTVFNRMLTPSTAHREVLDREGQGDAWRDRRRVPPQGCRRRRQGKEGERLLRAPARLRYHPASRHRRTLPLALPVGWCHAFPCLYVPQTGSHTTYC